MQNSPFILKVGTSSNKWKRAVTTSKHQVTSSNPRVITKKIKVTAKQHKFDIKTSIDPSFQENLVSKIKYIPNAMKFGT